MIIVGAGMAGLLAGAMLRGKVSQIIEAHSSLPHNHHALLRFPSLAVSHATGIPFQKVRALKAVEPYGNPVAEAIAYSHKNTGRVQLRSIISASGEIATRYIAPPDFLEQLKDAAPPIQFGARAGREFFTSPELEATKVPGRQIISTIPMPVLMDILEWPYERPEFNYVSGVVIRATLPEEVDIHATLYVPAPSYPFSRISITGRQLIIECPLKLDGSHHVMEMRSEHHVGYEDIWMAMHRLGLPDDMPWEGDASIHQMDYMKILPIDEALRRRFLIWATDNFGIYSLGRFATWRPGLLLDDVVNDVRVIQRMMAHGNYKERM